MSQKLNKCVVCRNRMQLIPMQTGKFKCRGWRAQCTSCGYGHGMRDIGWSEAIRKYNKLKPLKPKTRLTVSLITTCFAFSAVWFGVSTVTNNSDAELLSLILGVVLFELGGVLWMIRAMR